MGSWLDRDDVDEVVEGSEVVGVSGVERELCGQGGGSDEEVDRSGPTGFVAGLGDRREDPTVGAGGIGIERQRVEGGFSPLQPILAATPLGRVVGGARPGGQFCEGDGADGHLHREGGGGYRFEVDGDRGVE